MWLSLLLILLLPVVVVSLPSPRVVVRGIYRRGLVCDWLALGAKGKRGRALRAAAAAAQWSPVRVRTLQTGVGSAAGARASAAGSGRSGGGGRGDMRRGRECGRGDRDSGREEKAGQSRATGSRSHTKKKKNGCSVTNTTHKHMPDTHTYAH